MPVIIDIENDTLFKQGIEKGIERGIEKGMEKGMEKSNLKTILVGLKNGLSIDLISEITGLSPRQIDDTILRNNKN